MYPLEFKVTSTLHCFAATVKGALGKEAEHVLNESELLAVRVVSMSTLFVCFLFLCVCLSLSLTHTHTQNQKAWQACELSIMYVQHCIHAQARRLCGEKGLVLPLGLGEVTSAVSRLGEDCRVCSQLCLTLCSPMRCSSPGSSVRGIFQARILEWVTISHSRGSSRSRDRTLVSYI